ncbi:hypothetical protein D3C80_1858060 [compost metagenome]
MQRGEDRPGSAGRRNRGTDQDPVQVGERPRYQARQEVAGRFRVRPQSVLEPL